MNSIIFLTILRLNFALMSCFKQFLNLHYLNIQIFLFILQASDFSNVGEWPTLIGGVSGSGKATVNETKRSSSKKQPAAKVATTTAAASAVTAATVAGTANEVSNESNVAAAAVTNSNTNNNNNNNSQVSNAVTASTSHDAKSQREAEQSAGHNATTTTTAAIPAAGPLAGAAAINRKYPSTSGVHCKLIWPSLAAPSPLVAAPIVGSVMKPTSSVVRHVVTMSGVPGQRQPEGLIVNRVRQLEQQQVEQNPRGHMAAVMRTAHARLLLRPSAWIPGVAAAPVPMLPTMSSARGQQQQQLEEEQELEQQLKDQRVPGQRLGLGGAWSTPIQDAVSGRSARARWIHKTGTRSSN